jgi:hypothetical protein
VVIKLVAAAVALRTVFRIALSQHAAGLTLVLQLRSQQVEMLSAAPVVSLNVNGIVSAVSGSRQCAEPDQTHKAHLM